MTTDDPDIPSVDANRRTAIKFAGIGATLGLTALAGCGGPGNDDGNGTETSADDNETGDGDTETTEDENESDGEGNATVGENDTVTDDAEDNTTANGEVGQRTSRSLTVGITSEENEPVSNATVTIEETGGEIVQEGETDEDGELEAELENGEYTIFVEHDEYGDAQENVTIEGEDVEEGVNGENESEGENESTGLIVSFHTN